ncbi:hypothetical protein CS022_17795 [Veronia nyctiphanis]|uniref:Amidohydrolase 3 domain-containing protein n=1 Tax=Veronia nyctiphanis TaxID=1278244 RepID=A0A4Q0YT21_9GAMM|nr:amidohydrolase family protein [Veronia nyctiphanis]RXJ72121.1 hypothetical protein CS022_17795 [Veronia nyctiphanis]
MQHKRLNLLGIHKDTPNPKNGHIERTEAGKLTGLIQGSAVLSIYPYLNAYDPERIDNVIKATQLAYAQNGITTALEGAGNLNGFRILKSQADRQKLFLDINIYPNSDEFSLITQLQNVGPNVNGLRVAGVKLTGDGQKTSGKNSPIDRLLKLKNNKYLNQQSSVRILDQFSFNEFVDYFYANNIQIIAHSNADRATSMAISAIELAMKKHGMKDHRMTLVHMKSAKFNQLKAMKKVGIIPSFLALNIYHWGDEYHDTIIGPWKTSNFSPAGWANELGLPFTLHTDAPILDLDILGLIATAVDRKSKNGIELGKWHAISPYQAIEAVTSVAARQTFEDQIKGTLQVGKFADFVVLNGNPLTVDKHKLRELHVVETIKCGKTIFSV